MIAPPLNRRALLPTACLTYPKNYIFLLWEMSALMMVSKSAVSYL